MCEDRIGTGPPRARTQVIYVDLGYWAISGSIRPWLVVLTVERVGMQTRERFNQHRKDHPEAHGYHVLVRAQLYESV